MFVCLSVRLGGYVDRSIVVQMYGCIDVYLFRCKDKTQMCMYKCTSLYVYICVYKWSKEKCFETKLR